MVEVPGPAAVMAGEGRVAEESFKDVAAVIVDYSQGGVYGNGEYQDSVAAAARAAGALWIADEVVTGLGRSGRWLCYTRGSARPDIVTFGKPLGGGSAPVAALVVSRRVMEEMKGYSWQSYGTFRGHPLLVSTIPPTLHTLEAEGLVDRSAELGKSIATRLAELKDRHPSVKSVDGLGMHWTIELHGGDWRTWRADTAEPPIASAVSAAALEQDVLIPTSGEQDSLFLAPPLNIEEPHLDRILAVLDEALEVADRQLEVGV